MLHWVVVKILHMNLNKDAPDDYVPGMVITPPGSSAPPPTSTDVLPPDVKAYLDVC